MINLSSSNEELFKELRKDDKHVEYWHKKHYGGKVKYDKWQDEQLAKVSNKEAGYEIIGEMVDYHSLTSGNRWKSFEVTSSYGPGNAYTRMYSFCYFDTYGSVGAFMLVDQDEGFDVVLVFPSHFFLRYADRMDIEHRDAALVCEFFRKNFAMTMKISKEKDSKGYRGITLAGKDGVMYGKTRNIIDDVNKVREGENVYEIRTFLKYEQLTKKQKGEIKELRKARKMYEGMFGLPEAHTVGRMFTDKKFAESKKELQRKELGLTKKQYSEMQRIIYVVLRSTGDLPKLAESFVNRIEGKKYEDHDKMLHDLTLSVANFIKGGEELNLKVVAKFVHEIYGDDYDWNKWLWMMLNDMKKSESIKSSPAVVEILSSLQKFCLQGEYTYERIVNMKYNI